MQLERRNAIVTGASAGLGYAIARGFINEGANIAICGRNPDALEQARQTLIQHAGGGQQVFAFACDTSSEEQVNRFISHSLERFGTIEILVNNAGILGPMGRTEDVELAQWRQTLEVNFYGVLLASRALVPHFRSQRYGKIVNLSGGGATSPRPFFSAYAVSKAAVVRFTETLAEELRDSAIDVNAMAPGALNTQMLDQTLMAGPERIGDTQFAQAVRQQTTGGASLEKAVQLCIYLSSKESDGITGKLISAPWDPWTTFGQRAEDLRTTDIYTLRRIVPEDRSRNWIE